MKVPQTQSISTTCRDWLGLVDFVRKESRFRGFIDSLNNGIDSNIIFLYNECSNMWVFIKKESIYEN